MSGEGPNLDPIQARALELAQGRPSVAKEIGRVAQEVGSEAAQWAFRQWSLRERAKEKFGRADRMLFDREALEMATGETVATRIHARGFPNAPVADLTTGIGGDLIALSDGRPAVGYETVPDRAAMARHNLAVYGRDAVVLEEDGLTARWDFDFAFADPARREAGRRTLTSDRFSPPLEPLVERMRGLEAARIKLSPLLSDDELESIGQNRWFVSQGSECKECLVHLGRPLTSEADGVWAVRVEDDLWLPGERALATTFDAPQEHLYEADPAIIRAHALGNLGLVGLGDSNGYLTSSGFTSSPWIRSSFVVRWAGPWRSATVKVALRALSAHVAAVKQRGAGLDVAATAKALRTDGPTALELLVYRSGPRLLAVLAERIKTD